MRIVIAQWSSYVGGRRGIGLLQFVRDPREIEALAHELLVVNEIFFRLLKLLL